MFFVRPVRLAPAEHVIAMAQIVSGDAHAALEHDDRMALAEGGTCPSCHCGHHRVVREQSFITTMTFKELSMTSKRRRPERNCDQKNILTMCSPQIGVKVILSVTR